MKALLLAAGKATRLGSLSKVRPKCLLEMGDEVLLDRVIRQLREAGVTRFLINTHHLADQVATHIGNRADRDDFVLAHESELLGTLGTVSSNLDFFDGDPGWVLHADNYIGGDLLTLHEAFVTRPSGVWGSMLTFDAAEPSACGVVLVDDYGLISSFHEKVPDPPTSRASAATFIFSREIFELIHGLPSTATDISRDLIPHLMGRLKVIDHDHDVIDVGTPKNLEEARARATPPTLPHLAKKVSSG